MRFVNIDVQSMSAMLQSDSEVSAIPLSRGLRELHLRSRRKNVLQGTLRSVIVLGAVALLAACGSTAGTGLSIPAPSSTLAGLSQPSIPLWQMEQQWLDRQQSDNESRLAAERQLALQPSAPVQPPTTDDQERQRSEAAAMLVLGGNSTAPATQWGHGAHAGLTRIVR